MVPDISAKETRPVAPKQIQLKTEFRLLYHGNARLVTEGSLFKQKPAAKGLRIPNS
jgi:hypothetical protein